MHQQPNGDGPSPTRRRKTPDQRVLSQAAQDLEEHMNDLSPGSPWNAVLDKWIDWLDEAAQGDHWWGPGLGGRRPEP